MAVACSLLRPDDEVRRQNKLLLDATFLQVPFAEQDEDECLEGPPLSFEKRTEAAEYLLSIDNCSWKSDKIIHRCQYGCCNSVKESKLKLWVSLQEGLGWVYSFRAPVCCSFFLARL